MQKLTLKKQGVGAGKGLPRDLNFLCQKWDAEPGDPPCSAGLGVPRVPWNP